MWIKNINRSPRSKWHILDPSPAAKNHTYCKQFQMWNQDYWMTTEEEPDNVCFACDPSKRHKQ